jgi:hypothetical protein
VLKVSEPNQNPNPNKQEERVLTPEEQAYEDNLLKVLTEALGTQIKACGQYKLMFVPSEDKKGGTMMFVFLPAKNEGNGIAMDFTEVARFVMEIAKEYIQKHPIPKQSKVENDRFMVS